MVSTGSVAFFAVDARFGPCTYQSWETVLVAGRIVSCCVAAPAVIRMLLAGMIGHPAFILANFVVGEVILCCRVCIPGDYEAFVIDEARLPVIPSDDIGNAIPGVSSRYFKDFRVGILGGLAVDDLIQFIRMPREYELVVCPFVAFPASGASDVLGANRAAHGITRLALRSLRARWTGGSRRSCRTLSAGAGCQDESDHNDQSQHD